MSNLLEAITKQQQSNRAAEEKARLLKKQREHEYNEMMKASIPGLKTELVSQIMHAIDENNFYASIYLTPVQFDLLERRHWSDNPWDVWVAEFKSQGVTVSLDHDDGRCMTGEAVAPPVWRLTAQWKMT